MANLNVRGDALVQNIAGSAPAVPNLSPGAAGLKIAANSGGGNYLAFTDVNGTQTWGYFTVDSSGNLNWSGNVNIPSISAGSANQVIFKNASNVLTGSDKLQFYANYDTVPNHLRIGPNAGSVTTSNDTALEIMNNGGVGDENVAAISFHCQGKYAMHMHLRATDTGGGGVDGYFGIGGWSASSWRWYVHMNTGNMSAVGDVVSFVSDERLKTNIEPIENPLDKVLSLKGFTYNFNETAKELGFDEKEKRVGVSAQDVLKVLPEAVKPAPTDDKYYTVQYEKLVPLLIEAIKELNQKVDKLTGGK